MIFAPVLNVGLGAYGDLLSLLCVMLIASYLFRALYKGKFVMQHEPRNLMLVMLLVVIYGLCSSALIGSGDSLQVALRPIRAFIMFLGLYAFVDLYVRVNGVGFEIKLVNDVFIAIGLHALIMIAQFVIPEFRNFLYPYTFADQVLELNQQFRMAGLTSGGGAQLSVYQSIGLLLYPFVLAEQTTYRSRAISHIIALCIAVSLILSGRSGIISAFIFLPLAMYWALKKMHLPGLLSITKIVGVIALIGGGTYVIGGKDWLSADQIASFEMAINRGFDLVMSSEALSDNESIQELKSYIIFPDDPFIFLFGDPRLFEASYWMAGRIVQTDLGYVIFLYGYGVIGSIIQYSFYGVIAYYGVRYWKYSKPLSAMSILLVLVIMLFHAKEVFVFTRIGLSLTSFFILALFFTKQLERRRRLRLGSSG